MFLLRPPFQDGFGKLIMNYDPSRTIGSGRMLNRQSSIEKCVCFSSRTALIFVAIIGSIKPTVHLPKNLPIIYIYKDQPFM